jgi:hypothetical protein
MEGVKYESMKLSMSVTGAILVGAVAMILISNDFFPSVAVMISIPVASYIISVVVSIIVQYSVCKKVTISTIAIGDLVILLCNAILGIILFLEQIPIFRYMFGEYAPRSPITGLEYTTNSAEFVAAMATGDHYKLQILSNIVKSAVPVYLTDELKKGFVYFYWTFWMTMLPLYFMLGVQSIC